MKFIVFIWPILFLSACAGRSVKILDTRWVSMKHASPPSKSIKLKEVGKIEETYCQKNWTGGSYGLMDEVVKQAEQKYNLDYIRDASFTKQVGMQCVSVVGQGFRIEERVQ